MNEVETLYLDTSALLPYYREEPSSQKVESLLQSIRPPVLISDLTRVEFVSAISKWFRMGEISESQANLLENTFFKDIRTNLFISHPLTTRHYRQAEKWLSSRKTSLRTLDALHLACCLYMGTEMVTCDTLLHNAATTFGISSHFISS